MEGWEFDPGLLQPACQSILGQNAEPQIIPNGSIWVLMFVSVRRREKCFHEWMNETCCKKLFERSSMAKINKYIYFYFLKALYKNQSICHFSPCLLASTAEWPHTPAPPAAQYCTFVNYFKSDGRILLTEAKYLKQVGIKNTKTRPRIKT